jgi:5,10-methylenetetrahydrofolate reductase
MANLLTHLESGRSVIAAELRPPRAELEAAASMDAWIDTYHAVRRLTSTGTRVFLTDSAVGSKEEDNLRHLVINLGTDVPRSAVVPFLTCKHPLDYCLAYADRAHQHGFEALVVLGGDKSVGPPRCVEHAWQLRREIRARVPALTLGGWANPHGEAAAQVGHLLEERVHAEFYLTQIVSHHSAAAVEAFLSEAAR